MNELNIQTGLNKVRERLSKLFSHCTVDVFEAGDRAIYVAVDYYKSGVIRHSQCIWTICQTPEQLMTFERTCMEVFGER